MSIDPSALVCRGAILEGDVTVGAGSIIHPTARICATVSKRHSTLAAGASQAKTIVLVLDPAVDTASACRAAAIN